MNKCTCKKLDCDSTCLCACHREEEENAFPELEELNDGLVNIEKSVDLAIHRMQKYKL
jgi:hypothetical protein